MWSMGGIFAVAAIFVLFDYPSLVKGKRDKDFLVSCALLAIALSLAGAKALRIPLPNPLDWLIAFYKPFSDPVWSWLA